MKADSIIQAPLGNATSLLVGASRAVAEGTIQVLGHLVAAVVGLRRRIVRHTMTDSECERAGLPYGSTEKAIYLFPSRSPWWRFAVRLHRHEGENCIDFGCFGCYVEVWYVPAGA